MKITDSHIKKCIEEKIIIDKKMREHRWKFERFIVPLNDKHPFKADESVKVISHKDYQKIEKTFLELRKNNQNLQQQIEILNQENLTLHEKVDDLKRFLEEQEEVIKHLHANSNNDNSSKKGWFKL
ncbi:MAG: hypothetical protein KO217_04390 [Methanobacteriaceae archaeon]|nr:hypothetical protein [Methanobacteriaceae archaeon]